MGSQTTTLVIEDPGDRSKTCRASFRFSCLLLLLLLLPLTSFAQAHLWKYRPFRATDTEHSGDDHICDLRGDSDRDGKPDRLGDYVTVSGTVIAEPSTFETGGWIFWIRDCACGIMIYGEPEILKIGDSVGVQGWVRLTNGNYFFPETGLATLGDLAIENAGVTPRGSSDNCQPITLSIGEFLVTPETFGGNLVTIAALSPMSHVYSDQDFFMWLGDGCDSVLVYVDQDTGCSINTDRMACCAVTGIVTSMKTPSGFAPSPSWCIAPRSPDDVVPDACSSGLSDISWGSLKSDFSGQD